MKTVILVLMLAAIGHAQPVGQASSIVLGTSLPSTCNVGQVWFQGNSASGAFYTCTSPNTWTIGGGGGGVSSVTIAGTTRQVTVTGTCTITTSGTCTLSLPNNLLFSAGTVSMTPTSDSTTAFQFLNAAGTPFFNLDSTNGRWCNTTGTCSYALDITGTGRFSGTLYGSTFATGSGSSVGAMTFPSGPPVLSHNVADALTAVTSYQQNASSTGHIHDFQNSGGVASYVDRNGIFNGSATGLSGTNLSGDVSNSGNAITVKGVNGVPLCTGFTPTNGQALQYTTGSSPNPCYTAASSGGTPGGSSGQMQYNNSGAFGGQAFAIGGSLLTTTTFQRGVECATATIPYTSIQTAALTNSLAINASMPQKFRFEHMYLVESTQFVGTSVTSMTVSAGTSGTYTDVIPNFSLLVSGGQNNWYDRPAPPAFGTSTWNFVLYFTSVGANLSALTQGNLYVEVCGYAVQ